MPQVPLRRKFVQELDDVDRSYKRARLSKYLHDVTSVDALTSDDDAASNASNISSISRISSVSSLSTGSDADASSLTPSKFMERHFAMLEKEIHKLREEFCTTRVLRQKREVRLSAEHPHPKSSSAFTMALQLYGFPMSTCTRRVALIAKERNIPYELNVADLTKIEQKQPDYLPRLGQLFSQVTYITHHSNDLFDSRVIGRYLATLGSGPELVPAKPKARAKFEKAASVECLEFDPIAAGIHHGKAFKSRRGKAQDEERIQELVAQLESKLDGYEAVLDRQKYLAGDEVTLADLYHLPHGSIVFENLGLGNLKKRPNVERWWKDISSRPSWQAVKNGA